MSVIKVTPFRRWHMQWLQGDKPADGAALGYEVDVLMELEKQNSWTAVADGAPLACGGTLEQWRGRHQAWMYMSKRAGPHMGFITKAALRELRKVQGRIEFTVRADFAQGHRWAKMLGFSVENPPGILQGFGPEGENHVGYVRFNKG